MKNPPPLLECRTKKRPRHATRANGPPPKERKPPVLPPRTRAGFGNCRSARAPSWPALISRIEISTHHRICGPIFSAIQKTQYGKGRHMTNIKMAKKANCRSHIKPPPDAVSARHAETALYAPQDLLSPRTAAGNTNAVATLHPDIFLSPGGVIYAQAPGFDREKCSCRQYETYFAHKSSNIFRT